MREVRPLFVPLRRKWFEAFQSGAKRVEWRAWGPRWNERTAPVGRPVTISLGYSGARLTGTVTRCQQVLATHAPDAARAIYPQAEYLCAIHVTLDSDGIERN